MNFSTKEDINVPISTVFEMLSSFETFEQAAIVRGAEIERLDSLVHPGVGMKWQAQFVMRGKSRVADVEIVEHDPPIKIALKVVSQGLHSDIQLDLSPVSATETRVVLTADVRAKTLTSRVLLQSLKLTKSMLDDRLQERVAHYAREMEQRYQQPA